MTVTVNWKADVEMRPRLWLRIVAHIVHFFGPYEYTEGGPEIVDILLEERAAELEERARRAFRDYQSFVHHYTPDRGGYKFHPPRRRADRVLCEEHGRVEPDRDGRCPQHYPNDDYLTPRNVIQFRGGAARR